MASDLPPRYDRRLSSPTRRAYSRRARLPCDAWPPSAAEVLQFLCHFSKTTALLRGENLNVELEIFR